MRIVAGEYGSRKLKAVPGMNTRPTTDKIKESIFNMLGGYFDGGYCLDFYGGSGALAIEAVSRGMAHAVITEKSHKAVETILSNVEITKEKHKFTVLSGDNRATLANLKSQQKELLFDWVLLDPPYKKQHIVEDMEWLLSMGLVDEVTSIVCETDGDTLLPLEVGPWTKVKCRQYGQTMIHLYEKEATHNG